MMDSDSAKDESNSAQGQGNDSSFTDTINTFLQSSTDMDIAATLGLYDDPSSIIGTVLDTTGMMDPSIVLSYPPITSMSGSVLHDETEQVSESKLFPYNSYSPSIGVTPTIQSSSSKDFGLLATDSDVPTAVRGTGSCPNSAIMDVASELGINMVWSDSNMTELGTDVRNVILDVTSTADSALTHQNVSEDLLSANKSPFCYISKTEAEKCTDISATCIPSVSISPNSPTFANSMASVSDSISTMSPAEGTGPLELLSNSVNDSYATQKISGSGSSNDLENSTREGDTVMASQFETARNDVYLTEGTMVKRQSDVKEFVSVTSPSPVQSMKSVDVSQLTTDGTLQSDSPSLDHMATNSDILVSASFPAVPVASFQTVEQVASLSLTSSDCVMGLDSKSTLTHSFLKSLSSTATQLTPSTSSIPSTSTTPLSIPSTSTTPSSIPSTSTIPSSIPSTSTTPSSIPSISTTPSSIPSTSTTPSSIPSTSTTPSSIPSTSTTPSSIPSTSTTPSSIPSTSTTPSSIPSTSTTPSSLPFTSIPSTSSASTTFIPSTSNTSIPSSLITTIPSFSPTTTQIVPSTSGSTSPQPTLTPSTSSSQLKLSTPTPSSSSTHSTSMLSSSSLPDSIPKGLNLPLLQFLQMNFPGLQLDTFKDIFQVNALLAHTLQQQQQMQQQLKQTTQQLQQLQASKPASSSSVGTAPTTSGTKLSGSTIAKLPSTTVSSSVAKLSGGIPYGGPNVKLEGGGSTAFGTSVKVGLGRDLSSNAGVKVGIGGAAVNLGGGSLGPTVAIRTGGVNPSSTNNPASDNLVQLKNKTNATLIGAGASNSATIPIIDSSKVTGPMTSSSNSVLGVSKAGAAESALLGNRTPVFAQILANMKQQDSMSGFQSVSKSSLPIVPKQTSTSTFTSPLVLGRGKKQQADMLHAPLASVPRAPSPLHTATKSVTTRGGALKKMSTRTAAKLQNSQLAKTLIENEESETMEVDVGQPFQTFELPKHLRDHCYSRYNPEEGERLSLAKGKNLRVISSIPPARVSYAPQLPDSPTTLYKLLKVTTRKTSRRSSVVGSSRTNGASGSNTKGRRPPNSNSRKGRFTPSGGQSRKAGMRIRASVSRGSSNPSSRAASEEFEASLSSSGQSDEEFIQNQTSKSKNNRRRSQRTAGQRKRYIDDLNIAFSDEEMQDDIMNPRPLTKKEYRGYGEEEDWDFYEQVGGASGLPLKSSKHKTKTITVNPTAGFQYSDMYFEPPAEEANLVDRILLSRERKTETDEERKRYGDTVEEFYVKYKNYSYLHANWATYDKILVGDKRFDGKVKRYKAKIASLGAFVNVDDEPFNPEYTVVDRILDVATQTEVNNEVVTHYLVKWRSLPYEDATWELEEDVDSESIRKFNQLQILPPDDELEFNPRPPPNTFKSLKVARKYKDGNELRPYQLEGVNWLLFNWYARQNCILADEMGLGKTVQSIALLIEIMKSGIRGPFLVIAPLSTITNWQREFEAWSDFNIIVYHGSAYSRRLIHEYELYYRDSEGRVISDAFKFNAIITTYEVMLSDESELQSIQWRVVVIDEAHRLKNRNCKLLEELRTLDMEHRVLLTGTPLQNSVEELFSLLNFLEPSTFPSHVAFLQQFGDLKTEEQVEELKGILKPMMLRRLKEDVEKNLAPKEETIVEVELTVIQKQYYRAILERNFTFLSKSPGITVPSLLNVMMELRKCCNHPYLIQGAEQQIVKDFQARHPQQPVFNALVQASGKMVLIDKLLARLKESGHKVLIFSQMVRCLDILEDFLRLKGYFYERIDGNVRGIHRQEAIDRFSKPNSDRFVFLLCTRAGGLGINLTAADTVIIYDSDWNPQNDLQAQARCHRIGQNKSVKIYRLITHNTYEREMFDRASLKLGLDKAVLQSMQQSSSSGNGAPQLSKKEIEDLLKKGAYGAIMDEDDDANKFCEEDIDQILERRAHVIQLESEGSGSTFSKASFSADGSSDITVDDPDFWQKWAAKANLDLDELANKDSLVLDTPRLRRQVRRYGNDSIEEIVEMNEAIDEVLDLIPSTGKHGWTKLECLKVEKGLLVYGWREWKNIIRYGKFRKRKLGVRDVENIARNILMYCLAHFTGDDKVPSYILHLLDPSMVTENPPSSEGENFYYDFSPEDFQILKDKDPEALFQDVSYRKHLRRHSNKILLRTRQLHIMRWSIFVDHMEDIRKGVPAKSLGLDLPRPEEPPPASWWNLDCDHSLLVGIVKHGYEQFGLMRSDPALCFKAMCGEEPPGSKKKKKNLAKQALMAAKDSGNLDVANRGIMTGEYSDASDTGEESDVEGDSGPSTPNTKRLTRSSGTIQHRIGGFYVWPSLAEVNTRARRYVSAWIRYQRREETKQAHLLKEREKKEKFAEASRKKELKKAELAQKWSKREEQDFARVISFFGVEFNRNINRYDWTKFRQLANLNKKSDERLTLYLHDFKQMCWRVLKKKKVKQGVSGMRVEPISEEKASRCLQRISLLSTVREEIMPHPEFTELIKLCELSFEVPQWWLPGVHDTDLLRGVVKHGIYRSDQLIYGDTELSFKKTVPQTALFDPNLNQSIQEESEGSEEEGSNELKHKLQGSGVMLPLGWPKEKAIVIRMTRIVYAFRNKVWPKPMEGLDLFTPTVKFDASSSEESSEEDDDDSNSFYFQDKLEGSDSDYQIQFSDSIERKKRPRRAKARAKTVYTSYDEDYVVDIEGEEVRDFEIEKSHGLKLTLKKSTQPAKKEVSENPECTELEIKIPLVQLTFPSSAGMKRIPKKRPVSDGESPTFGPGTPESKKRKQEAKSSYFKIVDPKEISFTELTGHERVGVINRNTKEKLLPRQSPMLKNLRMWLEGHPHFNVEADWGPLVIEWGALKPEMYNRILQ